MSLILWRSRWGVFLTLGIMLADVAVNTSFGLSHGLGLAQAQALVAQTLFLGFVLGSAPFLLRPTPQKEGGGDAHPHL